MGNGRQGEYRCKKVILDLPDRYSKRGEGLTKVFRMLFVVSVLKITIYQGRTQEIVKGGEAHRQTQRFVPPWVGAKRKKLLARYASQIAGNGTSQAYFTTYK
ncbi:hypothetical protein HOLleu_18588 [Holothuria leucospilota]|uniref:Uncharacterized protein n=1 Tax=Holothuria leucospilota TaxID=206669 RepID=A0A9Q1C212_HOLLE|nr:hypothetical protein HOLleu_18588 [Holothuria leucospilota]